jgi:hypothetical protein
VSGPTKLIVRRDAPGRWLWIIGTWTGPAKAVITPRKFGHGPSQPAALALGLAALEAASARGGR